MALGVAAMALAGCTQSKDAGKPAIDLANFDNTVSAGEDFYQYACGGWMQANPLTPEYARYGIFDQLDKENQERLKSLIEELNALSREICASPIDPKEVKARVEQTKYQHKYTKTFRYLGAMLATSSFTLFFGGNGFDMVATAIIAFVMTFYDFHKVKKFNRLLNTLIPAFIGGSLSILLVKIGLGQNLDKVMIGSIMLLIPGIALGNSIRDLLCGDVISGAVRFLHSILLAAAIALGYFTSIALLGGLVL